MDTLNHNDNPRLRYDPQRRWGCLGLMIYYIIVLIAIIVMLTSCSRTSYVPVESVRTEYRDRDVEHLVTDTVHDTRLVWIKGDTVVDIREKEHIRTVEIHDTCLIERRDTIPVPYPVERPLSRWEQAKMDLGGIALGALAVIICAAVVWLAKKFRK